MKYESAKKYGMAGRVAIPEPGPEVEICCPVTGEVLETVELPAGGRTKIGDMQIAGLLARYPARRYHYRRRLDQAHIAGLPVGTRPAPDDLAGAWSHLPTDIPAPVRPAMSPAMTWHVSLSGTPAPGAGVDLLPGADLAGVDLLY